MTIKELINELLQYHPDCEIRILDMRVQGEVIKRLDRNNSCVYIVGDRNKSTFIEPTENGPDPLLAKWIPVN